MALLSRKSEGDEPEMDKMPDESDSSYDALADELGEILGLDPDKAQQLRDVICSLAREEMAGDDAEELAEEKKPSGLAILLKKGG